MTEETALKYLKELKDKYPEKAKIAKVPSNLNGHNAGIFNHGKELEGRQILEVPVQRQDIPKKVLEYADRNNLIIRDTRQKIYNNF